MKVEIIRSNRKTMSIQIDRKGNVIVRCNYKTKDLNIENFLTQKHNWINKKIEYVNSCNNNKQITHNHILGLLYQEKDGFNDYIDFDNKIIYKSSYNSEIALTKYTYCLFLNKLTYFSKLLDAKFTDFGFTKAKGKWGSCNNKGKILLNIKLIHLEEDIIDYVIIHELCHIKEFNHSKKFWSLLKKYCPNYKEIKNRLKGFSYILTDF